MIMLKPNISDAIVALGVDGGFKIKDGKVAKWYSEKEQPSEKVIQDKLKQLEKQYADNEYQRKRLEEYNAIGLGEQLDMIYHDIDGWKARIKAVKDKYPKPA